MTEHRFSVFHAKGHVEYDGGPTVQITNNEDPLMPPLFDDDDLMPIRVIPDLSNKQTPEPFFPRPVAGDDEPLLPTGVTLED
jgi:hypothetical protein